MKRGLLYAAGAYILWGLLPLYWKSIQSVPALEILCHRMAWSLIFLTAILFIKKEWGWLKQVAGSPRTLFTFFITATLLGVNWYTYIWSVNNGYMVEASLGYFINPLVSIVLGMVFLKERLRPLQWVAVALAFAGVLYLTLTYGAFPKIALILAFSFGFYGLIRKTAVLNSLEGLSLESAVLFLPAAGYLLFLAFRGQGAMGHANMNTHLLLAFSGAATATPLLFFAAAARSIPLSVVGIMQYIAPTLQFLLGVLVYGETFSGPRPVGFSAIWAALIIFAMDSVRFHRKTDN